VSSKVFNELHEGDAVIALYRADNPLKSTLYEASNFEAVS
jgi:hypothetical protein